MYKFPESSLQNSYPQQVCGSELVFCEPEANISSKFNRVPTKSSIAVKSSDAVDINSHLHWMYINDRDFEYLARTIDETVQKPYSQKLRTIRENRNNFTDAELQDLSEAAETLEQLLND